MIRIYHKIGYSNRTRTWNQLKVGSKSKSCTTRKSSIKLYGNVKNWKIIEVWSERIWEGFQLLYWGPTEAGYNSAKLGPIQVWSRFDCKPSCSICNICLNIFLRFTYEFGWSMGWSLSWLFFYLWLETLEI